MTTRNWQIRKSRKAHLRAPGLGAVLLLALLLGTPVSLFGQDVIQTASERTITISRGSSALVTRPDTIRTASVGDVSIADVVPFPPNQLMINAISAGSTSLLIWGRTGPPRLYTVEVTADVISLQRQVDDLFPGTGLSVTSMGSTVVLSGEVRDPSIVRKVVELATSQGIPVVNNVDAPAPEQILLHVEFAEVSRSTLREVGGDLLQILNPARLDQAFDKDDTHFIETLSEGFVKLSIEGDGAGLDAVIRALKNTGEFRSLAQPNLVTQEGQEATFLAGGEFPFPVIQGGGNANAVTIEWREFGIRLSFTPTITNSGNIRLQVTPEVSSLDFANGLTFEGFNIPTLLVRRVDTDVELRPGQTLAIGGLLDDKMLEDMDKIPVLGDIPILGFFFRSEQTRQERTELLVLVTPHILDPNNLPAQALPTGDPKDWDWDRYIRKSLDLRPDTTSRGSMDSLRN
jgi:pilus assembly protein CpaC